MTAVQASAPHLSATPANGLDIDFTAFGADFHMPGLGLFGELMDSLSSPTSEAAPVKVAKLDNVPSFQPAPVPGMRM
jgi:hypothetical protein|nr:hypothetical protein [Neorhizobium tomejilense]